VGNPSDNLVLIGYRGTGKTSLARVLATRLARPWCDADVEIERGAGKTIAEIFADGGEPAFRDWESRIIAVLSARRNTIIATGGGAILRPANRAALAEHGRFVWLTAFPETIHARIQADSATAARRPSLTRLGELDEIRALLAERGPIYAALAEVAIDTEGKSPAELADEVITALQIAPPAEAT
jgi:shikimate kinase